MPGTGYYGYGGGYTHVAPTVTINEKAIAPSYKPRTYSNTRRQLHSVKNKDNKLKIYLDSDCMNDILQVCAMCDKEVGWFSLVDYTQTSFHSSVLHEFYIYDLIVPEQKVSAVTTEISPTWVLDPQFAEFLKEGEKMKAWGHSHVNMNTAPSGQDITTLTNFGRDCEDYFISIIANKKGDIRMNVYLCHEGKEFIYQDVEWEIDHPAITEDRANELAHQLKFNVTPLGAAPVAPKTPKALTSGKSNGKPKVYRRLWELDYKY